MPGKNEPEWERREQLQRAAFEVASREGLGTLTVRAIAAEAGVSHGPLHFHFQPKDQIVRALLDRVLAAKLILIPSPGVGFGIVSGEGLHCVAK